ncbi:flavodoxin domain-containing protein [Henriciella sp.]|uniref:flavodoxin domain-containing protein n=1 Tax=Henriciella sp. TaxID=1968823 RepID=UPI00344D9C27
MLLFRNGAVFWLDRVGRVVRCWRRVRIPLTAPVAGYFAGLDAGRGQDVGEGADTKEEHRKLAILFGSETGNAAEIASSLHSETQKSGLTSSVHDMADYKVRKITEEQDILIVVSTHGEGEPPQPAINFFEFMESRKAPRLDGLRFSVLALGDSTYEFYCQAGAPSVRICLASPAKHFFWLVG